MLRKINNLSTHGTIVLGTIIPLYDEKVPEFWLLCNGQSCVGTEFYKKTGYETVPDLTGRFIRCIGGNSAPIGLAQEDCIRNITGSFQTELGNRNNITGAFYISDFGPNNGAGMAGTNDEVLTFDASRVVPTGPENRPINMAFPMIIYVGKMIETIVDAISLKKNFKTFHQNMVKLYNNIINNIRNLYNSPLSLYNI